MLNVLNVVLPWKAIVPVVFVSVAVVASTVDWKVVPPDWVTVKVPISVPTAPPMVTTPVVLIVKFEAVPEAVPLIALVLTVVAPPEPKVNVTPSESVAVPKVIVPLPADNVELPVNEVVPSVNAVLVVVTLPFTVVELGLLPLPEVETPPVKVNASLPLPKVTVPVFKKLTAFVIVLLLPVIDTLYA